MRRNFDEIFRVNADGSIESRERILRVGGVQFGPGVRLGSGVSFGGVDLSKYIGRDLEVREEGNIFIITGIY